MPIKSLSPYYVTTQWVNPLGGAVLGESYTLSIFIWDGAKASPPATAEYTKTIINPTASVGSHDVNIARLISDFIEFAPQKNNATAVIDGNNNQWVKTSVTYENDATVQQATTNLFSLGYSYGYEGENITTISNDILLEPQDYKVDRTGVFTMAIQLDESVVSPITVISYPDNEINFSSNIAATTDSSELISYMWVELSETTTDTYIEIVYNLQTTTLLIQDECKYTPIDIFFVNKEGAEQSLTFFKERTDSLSITSESYENGTTQPADGFHQFVRFNVQGRSSFNLNSGFVYEDMNDVFTQLLLSERIWIFDVKAYKFTPINIKSKQLEYKTRQKQRLINYSIDFDFSYNEINNI